MAEMRTRADRYDARFDAQDVELKGIRSDIAGLRQVWAERTGMEKAAAAILGVLGTAACAVFGPSIVTWISGLLWHH